MPHRKSARAGAEAETKGKAVLMKRRDVLTAGLALGAGTTLAAPAIAQTQPSIRWRLTSSFPKSLETIYGGGEFFAERVNKLTDGKFTIRVFAAGDLVPAFQALDAVQQGTVELCHTATYYYVGKDFTMGFGTALPFGLTTRQQNAWMYHGGGLDTLNAFFKDYGVIGFPAGNTGAQMGGWFRNEVNTLADFKGLKMRIPGLGGQVMARIGAVPQALPGGDIYPALERGAIDATEWVGPYDDEKLGFYKIAKHYYYPGWWEPCSMYHVMVNLQKWESLPKAYQEAIISAAREANLDMVAEYDAKNRLALVRLKNNGVQLHKFSDDIMQGSYKAATSLYDEEAAKNAKFKQIYDEWKKFRAEEAQWFALSESAMDQFFATKLQAQRRVHACSSQVRGRRRSARRAGGPGAQVVGAVLERDQRGQRTDALHHPLQLERLARDPMVHVRRHVPARRGLCAQARGACSRRRLLQQDVAADPGLGGCCRHDPVPDADGAHHRLAVDPHGRELDPHPGALLRRRRPAALADQDHDPARLRAAGRAGRGRDHQEDRRRPRDSRAG
jgi:TRAP-type mannitol/chloroaromatic compound transport system substrate-binding protein